MKPVRLALLLLLLTVPSALRAQVPPPQPPTVQFQQVLDRALRPDFLKSCSSRNVGVIKEMLAAGFDALSAQRQAQLFQDLLRHQAGKGSPEAAVRIILGGLGPGFVKFGQIMSSRSDMVGEGYRSELQQLTDKAPAMGIDQVQQAIVKATGRPLGRTFKQLDEVPLGVGSVAQVHRAQLHNNRWVAVKVIKPGIKDDLQANLGQMSAVVGRAQGIGEFLSPVLEELRKISARETDLSVEARATRRAGRLMRGSDNESTPHVYRRLSSAGLLVESLSAGSKATEAVKGMDVGARRVAGDGLMVSMFRQIFLDGFFHADPTDANVFIHAKGKAPALSFIDWGLHAKISVGERLQLLKLFGAVAMNKPEQVMSQLRRLDVNATGRDKLQPVVHRLMEWKAPVCAKTQQLLLDAQKAGLRVPHSVTLVAKALYQAEGLAQQIHPGAGAPGLSTLKTVALRYPLRRTRGFVRNVADRLRFSRPASR